MAVGGNARARAFFKEHGWDELGADKIPHKVLFRTSSVHLLLQPGLTCACACLQYQSRAAEMYRAQLVKDVAKAAREEAELGQDSPLAAAPALPSVQPPPSSNGVLDDAAASSIPQSAVAAQDAAAEADGPAAAEPTTNGSAAPAAAGAHGLELDPSCVLKSETVAIPTELLGGHCRLPAAR